MPLGGRAGLKPVTAIVVSVALFVILDLSILALNFHIARQIDQDSLAINLAGRQRMLSQQLAKQVLEQQSLPEGSARWQMLEQEFEQSRALFESTLNGFTYGGEILGSSNQPVQLEARSGAEIRLVLQQTAALWQSYQDALLKVKTEGLPANAGLQVGDELLVAVNQLTTLLEQRAHAKANLLRLFQSTAVVIVLLNFVFILWQLRRRFQSVANSNAMLQNLVDKMSTAVLLFNNQDQIQYANKAAGLLFGFLPTELTGKSRDELFIAIDDSLLGQRADGSNFTAHMEVSELVFADNPVQVVTISDITRQHEKDAHWRHLAYHDTLTGLPNRLLFEHRIKQDLSAAQRHNEFVALLTVDLDNFKIVNDKYGHLVGDEVLRVVAQRFRDSVRTEDLVARLGGDEFVVVLTRLQSESTAKNTAQAICRVLMEALLKPVITADGDIAVGGSIGVSFYPTDGDQLTDIMHQSDASMYRAKSRGLGCELIGRA